MDLQHHQTQRDRLQKAEERARALFEKVDQQKKDVAELEQRKLAIQSQIDSLSVEKEGLERARDEREQKSADHHERMMKGFDGLMELLEKALGD